MMSKQKKIPVFKNEEEEREFWAVNDSSEYVNWIKAKRTVFTTLKTFHKNHFFAVAGTYSR